jgi:predicted RNase H-like HicB family nuclease
MIDDKLWAKAEQQAARNYTTDFERDVLSDGQIVYMARNPELPGCKAQGTTIDEAKANLDQARIDYIYALLEENLPIPAPRQLSSTQQEGQVNVTVRTFSYDEGEIEPQVRDIDEDSDQSEFLYGLTLGGDLVKKD